MQIWTDRKTNGWTPFAGSTKEPEFNINEITAFHMNNDSTNFNYCIFFVIFFLRVLKMTSPLGIEIITENAKTTLCKIFYHLKNVTRPLTLTL